LRASRDRVEADSKDAKSQCGSAEAPATMRRRISGEGQKGGSAFFGLRYARVIGQTWRRERRAARG
jgi:hypothetical protein